MICGVSVKNALNNYNASVSLKWPNDIIVNGKKIGGILCESKIRGKKSINIVIGIGLNVNQDNTDIYDLNIAKASSLKNEYNKTFKRENIIASIVNSLESLLIHFPENKNKIIRNWERSCVHLNKTVELSVKSEIVKGIFIELSDNGCGVIKVNGELINVSSSTIS
tara:strand:+ start:936 stop:1433 length:498 start_codon:yes stop_codon:yes gene_type:complete